MLKNFSFPLELESQTYPSRQEKSSRNYLALQQDNFGVLWGTYVEIQVVIVIMDITISFIHFNTSKNNNNPNEHMGKYNEK